MMAPESDARIAYRPEKSRRVAGGTGAWWLWTGTVGVILLLTPVIALLVTHRDPDPQFDSAWVLFRLKRQDGTDDRVHL